MQQPLARGLVAVAVVALVVALGGLALGYLRVAPIGFLGFVLAVIFASILASTPPVRSPSPEEAEVLAAGASTQLNNGDQA